MDATYLITCSEGEPLERLFQDEADGHLSFGLAGQSVEMASSSHLLSGEVRFRGYVMEGFVAYVASARKCSSGLLLSIRSTTGARELDLDWLINRQVEACGCVAARKA